MDKLIGLLIVVGVLVFLFWSRKDSDTNSGGYVKQLSSRCFGDKEKMNRLINLELKRNPKLSREMAAKDAIELISRDNR